jgi:hypothetical protein
MNMDVAALFWAFVGTFAVWAAGTIGWALFGPMDGER